MSAVSRTVSSTLDLPTVLTTIVSRAVQLSGAAGGVIYEYDQGTQEFQVQASHRMEEELVEVLRAAPIHLGEGATGQAALRREPVQVPDIGDEQAYSEPDPDGPPRPRLSARSWPCRSCRSSGSSAS